jgi:hypothetical protein
MSQKASKVKLANPKVMKAFIVFCIAFQIAFLLLMILIQNVFNMTSEPLICSNLEHTVSIKFPYVSMIAAVENMLIILFGLSCDISLYVFMKKRNVQLIPWTSTQDDPAIPMKATLVTTFSLITEIFCVPLCLTFWYSGKMMNWLGVILGTLWAVGIVPALLIFTVKHQKKVEQKQPPRGLQFHGEDLQLEEFNVSNFQDIYVVPQSRADPLGILSHALPNQAQ